MKLHAALGCLALTVLAAVPAAAQSTASAERLSRPVPKAATPQAVAPSKPGKPVQQWIAAVADGVYYRDGCDAALRLASTNRRLFPSRIAAEAAGYRRSKAPGC